ncbi:MAG: hypothetical protein ACYC0H_10545, partial [Solirubrobacteraceae bacterium]
MRFSLGRIAVVVAAVLAAVSVTSALGDSTAQVPPTSVSLSMPTAAVPLAGGGFLIADSNAERVEEVDSAGNIWTLAGTGADCRNTNCDTSGPNHAGPDETGDNGPATQASLDDPTDAVPT